MILSPVHSAEMGNAHSATALVWLQCCHDLLLAGTKLAKLPDATRSQAPHKPGVVERPCLRRDRTASLGAMLRRASAMAESALRPARPPRRCCSFGQLLAICSQLSA